MIQRPEMPTTWDQQRAVHTSTRFQIATEDWDDVIRDWLNEHVPEEVASVWGIPDTSANPLADLSKQLSTPGLYGHKPKISHREHDRVETLIGENGHLDQARWLTLMVFVQYLTLALGDMFLRWGISRRGRLTVRLALPQNVYLRADDDEPGRAVELWELREQGSPLNGQRKFYWHVYDLGNGTRPPSYRVYDASKANKDAPAGEDVSSTMLLRPDDTYGALVGDDYPWVTEDGHPRFPFTHYKDAETGMLWNHFLQRGIHRGTLNTALYWTYVGHSARHATGSFVMAAGLEPYGTHIQRSSETGQPFTTQTITAGAITFYGVTQNGQQPFVKEVGPGVNLGTLVNFANLYEMKQAVRRGLNPSDLAQQHANPTSAAALMVSNEGKRDFSAQVEPIFRVADLDSLECAAMVLRQAGIASYPERGYSIEYHQIPRSPGEQDERRKDLEWQQERGLRSRVDIHRELHPGTSDEDAIAAIVKAAADEARLEEAIAEALAGEPDASGAPAGPDIQQQALNGAQVSSLREILDGVTLQTTSPEAAVLMLQVAFPAIPSEMARQMVEAAAAFEPATPEPPSAFGLPDPSTPPPDDSGDDMDEDDNPTDPQPEPTAAPE